MWMWRRLQHSRPFYGGRKKQLKWKYTIPHKRCFLALLFAVGIFAVGMRIFEIRLRPMVIAAAQTQVQNQISAVVEQAIVQGLSQRNLSYSDFVLIQRDKNGEIETLTSDMASMNLLRAELVSEVLSVLEGVDISQVQIPLGSLLDFDILWGRGPSLTVHVMTVGTVDAEFFSEFSDAGVNQTMHRIYLELAVPFTLMIPGGAVEAVSKTRLCVAETVIVGQVPSTYLRFGT